MIEFVHFLLTQVRKFYCVHPDPHICYKHVQHSHLRCRMMKTQTQNVASPKRRLIKHILAHDLINLLHYKH